MTAEWFKENIYILSDQMYRFAKSILQSEEDAKDLVQNILMGFWQKGNELKTIRNLKGYAMSTVRNAALNYLRGNAVKEKHYKIIRMYADDAESPPAHFRDILDSILEGLPVKQRMVFHLKDVEGYETREIAGLLEMDENAVRVNLSRARNAARLKLLETDVYEKRSVR